jgi:hypothetical protein
MKIESRITFIIIFLMIINLIYFRIAKNIQEETSKIIEIQNILNTESEKQTTLAPIYLIQTNERNSDDMHAEHISMITNETQTNISSNITEGNTTDNKHYDIVDEIGNNISEGVKPFPLPINNLAVHEQSKVKLYHENSLIMHKAEGDITDEIKPYKSHLVSFLIILVIITAISISLIAYQEYKTRKRIQMFNLNVRNYDGYYLLTD